MRCAAAVAAVVGSLLSVSLAQAGTFPIWVCGTWTHDSGVMQPMAGNGYFLSVRPPCPRGGLSINTRGRARKGQSAGWRAKAPEGMTLVGAWIPASDMYQLGLNDSHAHSGSFYWKSHRSTVGKATTWRSPTFRSPYFGWRITCVQKSCSGPSDQASLVVNELQLKAQETRAPAISTPPGTLWSQTGWVRGSWPLIFHASDPSGVCATQAVISGARLLGPSAVPNRRTWHQCPDQTFLQLVNTNDYVVGGSGSFPVILRAMNAAQVWTSNLVLTKRINVDNVPPQITLTGAHDALSTAGTQYITATASAGPSGIGGILCSVDNAPPYFFASSPARIPVAGIGQHRVACVVRNRAIDVNGKLGTSAPAAWALSIRQPTVSTVSFARIINKLRCKKKHERVHVPPQWIIEHIHGKRVRVHIPGQTRRVTVVRCHPRVVKRRVLVGGHWVTERVVLLPRRVFVKRKRVAHGSATRVRGWLGTAQGQALAHQRIYVLTAPANGERHFRMVATARTSADGGWSVRLRPGPSRLVKAVYGGGRTVEPSTSTIARLTVPSAITLGLSPNHTHWGGTIRISGRLHGGYVPPAGEVVLLRIGWRGGSTEIGHLYSDRTGRFHATYTFLRGNGTETYRIWATTAKETDYPFAPNRSQRIPVMVSSGG